MNSAAPYEMVSPNNKSETCVRFLINDTVEDPYTFFGVTAPGQEYVFSCWLRGEAPGTIVLEGSAFEVGTQWQLYSLAFTATGTDLSLHFTTAGTYYMFCPMLETGNKRSDWTPAPEDTEEALRRRPTEEVMTAAIRLAVEDGKASIRQEISQTYASQESLQNATNLIEQQITRQENTILLKVARTYATQETVNALPTESEMNAAIKLAVDQEKAEIRQEVSQTYATTNYADDAVSNYAQQVAKDMAALQAQIDGQVESFYHDYDPTLTNEPAASWTTEALRESHANDTFTNTTTGHSWRWAKVSGSWGWIYIEDSDVTKALADAAQAKEIAGSKRRTFIVQPVPPYDVGDLWLDGTDLWACTTARATGNFSAADWAKKTAYATETRMNAAITTAVDAGKASIRQEVSQTYATQATVNALPTQNQMNAAISAAVEKGNAQVLLTVSGTYAKAADVTASLGLCVKKNENGQIVSMLNASADQISITGNRLTIDSTNFKLTADGSMTCASGSIAGWKIDDNSIRYGTLGSADSMWLCRNGTTTSASIGGSASVPGWCIGIGSNFGVTKAGKAYLRDAYVSGEVVSDKVTITGGSLKIPISDITGAYAVMDHTGVGCSSVDFAASTGSAIKLEPGRIKYESGTLRQSFFLIDVSDSTGVVKKTLYGTWYIGSLGSSTQVTSDRNAKYDIAEQPVVYSRIFDRLRPVVFKYKDGTSNRLHTGLIAQDVEDAVLAEGISTREFAAVCYDLNEAGEKHNYGIRYEELVSMLVYEVQQAKARIRTLESKIA